ncbi:MAG TPA: hypothetical protein VGP90_13260, partial [Acidimicrobiia bacterium]|nr:hypothetical protein [Acidimicrobiia bacterium]
MTSPASPTLDSPSLAADVDEDWTTTGPKKGIRLRLSAMAAIVAAVALLGMGTGATLKGRSASTTAGTSAGATAGPGAGQAGPGGAGVFGRPTTGTVTKVDGRTVQLTDSS